MDLSTTENPLERTCRRARRLGARRNRLKVKTIINKSSIDLVALRTLPPRPPPSFSPPPVPNVPSHDSCINNELSMEVKRLKAKCGHLTEALLTRKSPNLELQFLFVDILYLQFIEECNMQATNETGHHTQAANEIIQLMTVDRRRSDTEPLKVLEHHGASVQWQADKPKLRTLMAQKLKIWGHFVSTK
ncbi:hypothetical protein MVEN_00128000 [Mycena venus]|uniref:Uncharacterized protein n=1 Tax=Mycena venus TaxID=2733690 RepID=A0A8H6Z8N4_9AGAR|nr:hypothetical protein MVEN_00128000 [Mycena venus]